MSYSTDERWIALGNGGVLEWVQLGKRAQYDIPLDASFTTDKLDALNFDLGVIEVFWSGMDKNDGTVQVEGSISNIDWFPMGGNLGIVNLSADPGCVAFDLSQSIAYKYLRLKYILGTSTTGTMKLRSLLKSRL